MKGFKRVRNGLCAALAMAVLLCGVPALMASAAQGLETNLEGSWTKIGSWEDTEEGKELTAKSGDWGRIYATEALLPKEDFTAELVVSDFGGTDAQLYLEFGILDPENPRTNADGMAQVRIQELEKDSANNVSLYACDGSAWARKAAWKDFPAASDIRAFTVKAELTAGDTTTVKIYIDGQLVTEGTLDNYKGGYFGITTYKADVGFTAKKLLVTSDSLTTTTEDVTTTTAEDTTTTTAEDTTTAENTTTKDTTAPTTDSEETVPPAEPTEPSELLERTWSSGYGVWEQKGGALTLTQSDKKNAGAFLPGLAFAQEPLTLEAAVSGFTGETADITNPLFKLVLGIGEEMPSDPAGEGVVDLRLQDGKAAVYEWNADAGKMAAATGGWKDAAYGEAFTLKVELDAGKVTVSIDGTAVGTWTLGRYGDEYRGGSVGIATWGAANGLKVSSLKASAASLEQTDPEGPSAEKTTTSTTAKEIKPVNLLAESWKAGYGTWTQSGGRLVLSAADKKNAGIFLTGSRVGEEKLVLEASVSGFTGETAEITNPLFKLVLGVDSAVSTDPVGAGIVDIRVQDGKVAVYEWNADANKMAAATGSWKDAAYGEAFTLKAELDAGKVTVSIDGAVVGTWTLGRYGDEYRGGGFGIATWGAAGGLTIEKLEATAASLQDGSGSPSTGENLPVLPGALFLAAAACAALLARRRVRG
ncbi:MAG TPA: hypothetical protein H9684_05010 [Firmicutes bacterium]|nr:hypothetical protein [Bacillota bacterium]